MARRVLEGSRLYVDLVEVNPPLVVWLKLPLVALGQGLGWSESAVYRGAVWVAIALSLELIRRLLSLAMDPPDGRRTGWLLGVVLLLAIPGPYFGQREHLILILFLPWLIAAAARIRGAGPGQVSAAVVGLMAAVGLALKPHYLPVALGIALYVRALAPAEKRGLPPEQIVAGVLLLIYAAGVAVAAPGYGELVSRLGAIYWDYHRLSVGELLFNGLASLTALGSLVAWPLTRRLTRYPALADLLGITTLGFLLAVVLQHKGFGYHYYPALATGLLALFLGALGGAEPAPGPWLRIAGRAVVVTAAIPCVVVILITGIDRATGGAELSPGAVGRREVGGFLRAHPPAGPVLVLSGWMEDSFPVILESGVPWGSRYPLMWFFAALHRDELNAGSYPVTCRRSSPHASVERELVENVSEDLRRHRPELVFVRRVGDRKVSRIDMLACFSRHPMFRDAFSVYRPRAELEHFVVFERSRS